MPKRLSHLSSLTITGWILQSYAAVGKTPLKWSVHKDGPGATCEVSSSPDGKKQ